MANKLSQVGKTAIEQDADLFAAVSKALNVKPLAIQSMLIRDSRRLIEYPVLAAIADHLKVEVDSLVEEQDEPELEKVA